MSIRARSAAARKSFSTRRAEPGVPRLGRRSRRAAARVVGPIPHRVLDWLLYCSLDTSDVATPLGSRPGLVLGPTAAVSQVRCALCALTHMVQNSYNTMLSQSIQITETT